MVEWIVIWIGRSSVYNRGMVINVPRIGNLCLDYFSMYE
jgi:hypothetical protein